MTFLIITIVLFVIELAADALQIGKLRFNVWKGMYTEKDV
jgi:hypothetical protein